MRRRTFRFLTSAIAMAAVLLVWDLSSWLFPFHSLNHDEAVYLQQAAMLLDGQVNLRPPVEGAFRPWFFVEDGGRLYPKYAPVPAAIFALGELVGGPRLALAGVAAGNVALVSLVLREVFDRRTGLLAAAFVLCSPLFLLDSAVFLPYAPTTLLNLAFAYAYFRADRARDWRWGAVAGLAVGLAFFARPYTAVLFAAPFVAHALWTLRCDVRGVLNRQAVTAASGLFGVGVTLAYNALMTGSPWVFPYEAFAPLDGIGFGRREMLGHSVIYDPELAIQANRRIVELFFSEWVAGGLLGSGLAAFGLFLAGRRWAASRGDTPTERTDSARRAAPSRQAVLAGLFLSVVAGNVLFWGNYNLLGALERPGDGLVAVLGPYYHFDLLLPTAAFAARGALEAVDLARHAVDDRLDPRTARVALLAAMLLVGGAMAGITAQDLDRRIERNAVATETYETVYEPFEGGPPAGSVVLLPTPYGDWLNHPFQALRNDAGFDGGVVYAIDERPFAVADAYPDRRLYRHSYRGTWAPYAGSPRAARLERVRDVSGETVSLDATLGVPDGAVDVTTRVATDEGSAYAVGTNASDDLGLRLAVADGRVGLDGDIGAGEDRTGENRTIPVHGRDTVVLTVFVDYGAGDGFTYRLELPVVAEDGRVRALSPRMEYCRSARECGGSAAYVPGSTPEGVFVRSDLRPANETAREHNG